MKTLVRKWSLRLVAASLVLGTLPAIAQDDEGVVRLGRPLEDTGVVRVTDFSTASVVVRGQSENGLAEANGHASNVAGSCPVEYCQFDPYYSTPALFPESEFAQWFSFNMYVWGLRRQQACATLKASCKQDLEEKKQYLRCKFGYFVPTGAGGKGAPPWGHYKMVYPVDPYHFDQRDGQVYAAPGHNGPVAVPIAPVVNHTYNYGWGIPSSRLTPIAHPLTPGVPTP